MSDVNPTKASPAHKHSVPKSAESSFGSVRRFLLDGLSRDLKEQRAYNCSGCKTGCLNPADSVPARFDHCVDCVASLWVKGSVRERDHWGMDE